MIRLPRLSNTENVAVPLAGKGERGRICLADYPQLRLIAWNRRIEDEISDEEALALYERNWRHIDQGSLSSAERYLINHLVRTVGKGVLHV